MANRGVTSISETFTLLIDAILGAALYVGLLYLTGAEGDAAGRASALMVGITYFFVVLNNGVILYRKNTTKWQILQLVLENTVTFGALSSILLLASDTCVLPIKWMCLFFCGQFLLSLTYRLVIYDVVRKFNVHKNSRVKIVFVGCTRNNRDLYDEMTMNPYWNYAVIGYFDHEENPGFSRKCPYLGRPDDVVTYLEDNPCVTGLFCSLSSVDQDIILPMIHYCMTHMIDFYSVPDIRNYLNSRMHFNMLGNVPYFSLYITPLSSVRNKAVKRLFDICFSLACLCTLFPLIVIVVAVVSKITMPGPIFFLQKRTGLKGKPFYCIKFRSMKINTDSDIRQATKDDSRTTKWSSIMRRTSIDELPQFINVLLGDMSVVGPRPHMERHTDIYSKLIDKYMMRHLIKPGITGWSQVTGFRGETKELWQMEERIKRDVWYIEHWSLGLDLFIIYKTVANGVTGDANAY